MMKKILLGAFAFVFCISIMSISQYAMKTGAFIDFDDVHLDSDGDGRNDVFLEFEYDTETKTCSITSYGALLVQDLHITIPSYLDVNGVKYQVTAITNPKCYDEVCVKSVEIPSTITKIEDNTLGYAYDYSEDSYNKIDDFTINYVDNTAGETYAVANGFEGIEYKNMDNAVISGISNYTYTGGEICPMPTVTFDGVGLIKGVDYTVSYSNNTNAGTAEFTVTGIGDYRGIRSGNFTISPKSTGSVTVSSASEYTYTGKAITPAITARDNGKTLSRGTDYTVAYSNNVNVGTGKITVTFTGNYTGTKTLNFSINVPAITNLKATGTSTRGIKLSWKSVPCTQYRIYRYVASRNKYVCIATTTTNSYKNLGLSQGTAYKFKVRAVVNSNSGATTAVTGVTKPSTPSVHLVTMNKAVKVVWSKNSKASGYQIYRGTDDGPYYLWDNCIDYAQKITTIRNSGTTSFKNSNLSNDKNYRYCVRAFVKIDGKTYFSDISECVFSSSAESRLYGASLKSHTSYKVYNRQGSTQTSYTITLTQADINTLKKFAKTHFTSSMTRYEKVQTTLEWINKNVTYARDSNWNQISGKTWVDAIFNYRKGQCAQYNGALIGMMAYLGYDVNIVQGYRGSASGSHWQHFWGEVKIQGQTYVMEAGNFGEDGIWSYNCAKYSEAGGYIMFNKNY